MKNKKGYCLLPLPTILQVLCVRAYKYFCSFISFLNKRNYLCFIITFFCISCFFAKKWQEKYFFGADFESVWFLLNTPMTGVDYKIVRRFLKAAVLYPLIITCCVFYIRNIILFLKKIVCWVFENKNAVIFMMSFSGLCYFFYKNIDQALIDSLFRSEYSDFYEKHYVKPEQSKIVFPQKKNLIFVSAESFEASFSDINTYGQSLIPDIEAVKGVRFDSYINGYGTAFTQGSIIANFTGLPIYSGAFMNFLGKYVSPFKEELSLGKILKNEGYETFYLSGMTSDFSGTKQFLEAQGITTIMDKKYIQKNFSQYQEHGSWGYGDSTLFAILKEKLQTIDTQKPFFFFISTIDTHANYKVKGVPKKFKTAEENTIYNTNLVFRDFLDWIQKQDFYDNTVIVIAGDHLRAGNEIAYPEKRYIYNLFVNTKKENVNTKRTFSQIDMFPTILDALGAQIEENQLGLGVSVFSDKKTLLEQYSFDELKTQLSKRNHLYNKLWGYTE